MKTGNEIDFQAFIDEVKARNPIEDVIEETGGEFALKRKPGREIQGVSHTSLHVNQEDDLYVWFSKGNEGGDVFTWLKARNGMQFFEALEYLARRARLEMPRWNESNDQAAVEMRGREDVFSVAQSVMVRWLKEDPEAWAYVREGPTATGKARFFSEETIERSGIGFTGRDPQARKAELREAFTAAGIDFECPAAVAILGYQGDIQAWAARYQVKLEDNPNWVEQGWISGLLGAKRIVFPHMARGRTRYYSARNILGSEVNRDGSEHKSYNLAKALAGPHQLYLNWEMRRTADQVAIVEGPGDAIALGQMGMPAAAMLGVAMSDFETELRALRFYKNERGIETERTVYLGIDADEAGWASLIGKKEDWPAARIFGPMARVIDWGTDAQHRKYELVLAPGSNVKAKKIEVKDANDYLAAMIQAKKRSAVSNQQEKKSTTEGIESTEEKGKDEVGEEAAGATAPEGPEIDPADRLREHVLGEARPLVLGMAQWAAAKKGADRDAAVRMALASAALLGDLDRAQLRGRLAKTLDVNLRELDSMIKAVNAAAEKIKAQGEPVYTWGGSFDGWLVEYLYDIEMDHAKLAWRDPDGIVGSGESVNIEGMLLMPYPPNDSLRSGAILFPSDLGERKSIRELVTYIRMYLGAIYLLPSEKMASLVAYWILTTWLYDSFETVIYLRAMGGAGSGKSELMRRIGLACYRTMTANGAGSTSSLFRTLERYKGTVFIDEADIQNSDTENDMVKFYNLGAMRGNPIWRTVEVTGPNGEKDFDTVGFQTFCPKLVAMRKEFRDDAIGSRSLTLKLVAREMTELIAAGIPLTINNSIRAKAQALRNMLVRWRLETWEPEICVDANFYDLTISARLNQVAGPLLAIAREDHDQQEEIRMTLREYYAETIINQSMTIAARVVEAMWKIWQYPDLVKDMVKIEPDGSKVIKIGDITRIANEIMDEMNDEKDDDDERKKDRSLKPQRIGRVIRDDLQMQVTSRRRDGFYVFWNEPKMLGLSTKYGINPEDFGPKNGKEPIKENVKGIPAAPIPTQGSLVNL